MRSSELKQRTALVLYGSETGNAQDVAEEIGRLTQRLRFDTTVLDLDSIEIVGLPDVTSVQYAHNSCSLTFSDPPSSSLPCPPPDKVNFLRMHDRSGESCSADVFELAC